MAGAAMGDGDEAVQVNVTPLIDIIFCLCLFFLCSLKFKQLEGKMDSWLPKDKGNQAGGIANATMDEIRIFVRLNAQQDVEFAYGSQNLGKNLVELERLIKQGWADFEAANKKDGSVIIDGEPRAPWKDVISVLDICKKNKIEKVEFAQPMPTLQQAGANKPS
jgi:biopolymer transport protein ExbD